MRRLLLAADGSENSLAALHYALSLDHGSVQLHACYVVDYANVGALGRPAGRRAPDLLAREGRNALTQVESFAAEEGQTVTTHMYEGDRVDRLLECAKRIRADAIVIGTRGKGRGIDRIFGSTTRGLLRRATLPVIVVSPFYEPARKKRIDRILVGFDGSAAAREVAKAACDLALQWDAQIDFVYVVDADRTTQSDGDDAEALGALVLSAAAQSAAKLKIFSKQYVLRGRVHETLAQFAREHDAGLIALGTHGRTGFDRLIMGSIAEALASSSPIPVCVVRHVATPVSASV